MESSLKLQLSSAVLVLKGADITIHAAHNPKPLLPFVVIFVSWHLSLLTHGCLSRHTLAYSPSMQPSPSARRCVNSCPVGRRYSALKTAQLCMCTGDRVPASRCAQRSGFSRPPTAEQHSQAASPTSKRAVQLRPHSICQGSLHPHTTFPASSAGAAATTRHVPGPSPRHAAWVPPSINACTPTASHSTAAACCAQEARLRYRHFITPSPNAPIIHFA